MIYSRVLFVFLSKYYPTKVVQYITPFPGILSDLYTSQQIPGFTQSLKSENSHQINAIPFYFELNFKGMLYIRVSNYREREGRL